MSELLLRYLPTLTCYDFHASECSRKAIMGPIGSGKSTACCWEIWRRAHLQKPDGLGRRRTRWAIIRRSYPMLSTTTLKTWLEWFPPPLSSVTMGSPITITVDVPCVPLEGPDKGKPDGTRVQAEVLLMPLDDQKDLDRLKSLELTGAWVNEARELPVLSWVTDIYSRTGRYPAHRADIPGSGATWSGILLDTNPPDTRHWWYRLAEQERPKDWAFFRQPGAIRLDEKNNYVENPTAENVGNHARGFGYWLSQVTGADPEWIKVYLMGEYGSVFSGRPVFDGVWVDSKHVAKEPIPVYPGLPILLGWDFGLTPACVVCQLSPRGQLRVLEEFFEESSGITRFAQSVVKPALIARYPGMPVLSTGDPAGNQRAQTDEKTCIEILASAGIPTQPAATNAFIARRESVIGFLTRMADEGQSAFLLDPRCQLLREGFLGGYAFKRVPTLGAVSEQFRDEPEKTIHSHIMDALQYVCLRVSGFQQTDANVKPAYPSRRSWGGAV